MKEPHLSSRFDEAVATVRADGEFAMVLKCLGGMRDAVVELQEENPSLSLVVRPNGAGCTNTFAADMLLANGEISVDGTKIDFSIGYYNGSTRFAAKLGPTPLTTTYIYSGTDMKKDITSLILQVGARTRALNELNVGPAGGLATVKEFSVAAPLKLKNPPKP